MRVELELSTSFQPMKCRDAGFRNETLQCPASLAAPWTSLQNRDKFRTTGLCTAGRATSASSQHPAALLCPVREFMTVAGGDTSALIMPVRAECCSSTGPACPPSASLVPPAPINTYQPGVATSLLYSGSQFRGYQKSKGNSYDVEVVLQVMRY